MWRVQTISDQSTDATKRDSIISNGLEMGERAKNTVCEYGTRRDNRLFRPHRMHEARRRGLLLLK